MKFKIAWRNKANGRCGIGKNLFDKAKAIDLEKELNKEYPGFIHTAIPETETVVPPVPEPEPPANIIALSPL